MTEEPPLPASAITNLVALQTQVKGIEADYVELKGNVLSLDRKIDHSFSALNSKLEISVNSIQSKLDERSRTPWGVIWTGLGVAVAFLGLIGSLLYLPIKDTQTDLGKNLSEYAKLLNELAGSLPSRYVSHAQRAETMALVLGNTNHINKLEEDLRFNYVNYREHERLVKQSDTDLNTIRKDLVSRAEHEQHWKSAEERNIVIQHQLDETRNRLDAYFSKQAETSVWTPRDELQKILKDISDLKSNLGKTQSNP